MPKNTSQPKSKYEVRQVEAWADGEDGWNWNNSWVIGHFYTRSDNVGRVLVRFLHKEGIHYKRRISFLHEFPYTEIVDRKTNEPLFAAIWTEEDVK